MATTDDFPTLSLDSEYECENALAWLNRWIDAGDDAKLAAFARRLAPEALRMCAEFHGEARSAFCPICD